MKRAASNGVVLVLTGFLLLLCGCYNAARPYQPPTSGVKFRAFLSNPLVPALQIIDASKDQLAGVVNVASVSPQPGLMVLSPNKKITLVFSALNNSIAVIDNLTETVRQGGGGPLPAISLPDFTESMAVSLDGATGYAAVRNAPVAGQPAGAIEVLDLQRATIADTLPVPNVHFIVPSHNGNRILAFGDNSNTVTVIAPSLIGSATDPRTFVCCFDHPVWGIFSSDDTTAFILSCGPECGGSTANVTVLDLSTNSPGASVPVSGATIGLLSGTTLFVAGTPPSTPCGSGTLAATCGTLDVVDVADPSSMRVTGSATITDGYHNRMEMGSNGQVFIGARTCTNITPQNNNNSGEIRGCLSVFNASNSSVVLPPENGDVTGLQPIANRNVVYVVEGGELHIFDTTTDKLQSKQINIIGQAVDVKVVDF